MLNDFNEKVVRYPNLHFLLTIFLSTFLLNPNNLNKEAILVILCFVRVEKICLSKILIFLSYAFPESYYRALTTPLF